MFSSLFGAAVGIGMYRGVQKIVPKIPPQFKTQFKTQIPKFQSHLEFYKTKALNVNRSNALTVGILGSIGYYFSDFIFMSHDKAKIIKKHYDGKNYSYNYTLRELFLKSRANAIVNRYSLEQKYKQILLSKKAESSDQEKLCFDYSCDC